MDTSMLSYDPHRMDLRVTASSDNLVMLNATPRGEPRWIQREINEMTAEVLSFPRGRPWILFEYVNVQEDSDMSVL